MELFEIQKKSDSKIFHFVDMRSDGYILESIKLHINKERKIIQIDIQELKYGFCSFGLNGELLLCQAWESEEEAQSKSYLAKHYTSISSYRGKGLSYAKKIYQNIDKKIKDNYLRFILKGFIVDKHILKFEESYYKIHSSSQTKPIEDNIDISQIKKEVPALTNEILIEQPIQVEPRKRLPTIAIILLILILASTGYFLFSFLEKSDSQPKLENPSSWSQPTRKDLELLNDASIQAEYIYRKRDYAKIINTSLFPTFPLLDKEITKIITDYAEKSSEIKNELERTVPKIKYSTTQEFFDKIYKFDKEDQVVIFHNEFIKQKQLSNFQKAELLGTLYRENLTRLLYRYSFNPIVFISDYLDSQTNKGSLIQYLFFLIHEFPDSEISVEAFLILQNIFEIQENGLNTLYNSDETNICETKGYSKIENPLARMVCKVYKQNKFFETDYPQAEIQIKYRKFREHILDYALNNNPKRYRLNDIKFKKTILVLSSSPDENVFTTFNSIEPEKNYGKFLFKDNYFIF